MKIWHYFHAILHIFLTQFVITAMPNHLNLITVMWKQNKLNKESVCYWLHQVNNPSFKIIKIRHFFHDIKHIFPMHWVITAMHNIVLNLI